ncbi:MAG: type II toxin-antitoxin system RelB/DinJ family antitoxin [Candidatus Adiutrix sp.]|jgi:addiction module RelB/DinJ family antitoxin|nr:type II toxin-antitoxin system RelB/DinJ family antitoxin [Candidatus Adiutrix sp.]
MSTLVIQVDEQVQAEAAAVLNAQGLSISDVVQMTLKQITAEKRLPADLTEALPSGPERADSIPSGDDLTYLPAFGMWADREDMENPAEWVRHLRRGRYRDL